MDTLVYIKDIGFVYVIIICSDTFCNLCFAKLKMCYYCKHVAVNVLMPDRAPMGPDYTLVTLTPGWIVGFDFKYRLPEIIFPTGKHNQAGIESWAVQLDGYMMTFKA